MENQKPSQLEYLHELLDKYDKLRSFANSASFDKKIFAWLKFLKRITELELFKKISRNTYDLPFASEHVRREIRITLRNIFNLHEINYLRTERNDKNSKKAMDVISEYLKEVPKTPSIITRLNSNAFNILGVVIGMFSITLSIMLSESLPDEQKSLLIGVGISVAISILVFLAPVYLYDKVISYFLGWSLYNDWMKRLAIKDLKKKMIIELIAINEKTYDELEKKFKSCK